MPIFYSIKLQEDVSDLKFEKRDDVDEKGEPESFKYLIMKTDYVARLLNKNYWNELKSEMTEFYNCDTIKINTLYINDTLWGKGFYCKDEDMNLIKEFNNDHEIIDGSVAFYAKNGMNLNQWLYFSRMVEGIKYCNIFGLIDIKFSENAITLKYDSESG